MGDNAGRPDVLADRHANLDAAELDGLGHRSRREDALLVEDPVVGEVVLEAGRETAVVDDDGCVVDRPLVPPRRGHDHGGSLTAFARQAIDDGVARINHRRAQDEVFRRVADNRQLGEHHEIGARSSCGVARAANALEIAFDVSDCGIDLREGDAQLHGAL